MISTLEALVNSGSAKPPVAALRSICALFMRAGFDGRNETVAHFDDAMTALAAVLDDESIQALAPGMAQIPGVLPRFIAAVTARFEALTAPAESPAHVRNPASGDRRARTRDPVEDASNPLTRARRAEPSELLDIASAPELCEHLTGVIASRGYMPAIVAAISNPGARFSSSTLMMLVELAPGDLSLRDALLDYPRLPGPAVDRMWPIVGREARARLFFAGAYIATGEAWSALAADVSSEPEVLAALLADVRSGETDLSTVVEMLSDEGRLTELASVAAEILEIAHPTAVAMLSARLDQTAAILIRALDVPIQTAEAVMTLRQRCRLRASRDMSGVREVLERFDQKEATLIVRLIDGKVAARRLPVAADQDNEPVLALAG